MLWITRSYVHVDRVACPWLITRFIDSQADFMFAPARLRRRPPNLARFPSMRRVLNSAITRGAARSSPSS